MQFQLKKQFIASFNIAPASLPYSEQFARQSDNAIRAVGINNQLAINIRCSQSLRIYNRMIDAVTDFNGNVTKGR
jgi:hypothetical protein